MLDAALVAAYRWQHSINARTADGHESLTAVDCLGRLHLSRRVVA